MSRTPRRRSSTGIYHIVIRGVGKQIIFEDDFDRRVFVKTLSRSAEANKVEILAWCLMSDHVHLLVLTTDAPGKFMQSVNTKYAVYFNKRHERGGHLFQDRFKSEPVEDDVYLMTVVRYIHQNPLREGMCKLCAEYPWSSYSEYIAVPKICNTAYVLSVCGGTERFEELHRTTICRDEKEADRRRVTDTRVIRIIRNHLERRGLSEIGACSIAARDEIIRSAYKEGASKRQLQRVTGLGYKLIDRAIEKSSNNNKKRKRGDATGT